LVWIRAPFLRLRKRRDVPENRGHPPKVERCDIRFRNGTIARGVDPTKYRWKDDPRFPPESAGDIIAWRPS
jgi:hypothetical protein